MRFCLVIALIFSQLLNAQQQSHQQIIHNIQQNIHSNPDVAKTWIDKLFASTNQKHDTIWFDGYKAYAMYYNAKGDFNSSILYLNKAIKHAKTDAKRQVQAFLNISESYRKLNDRSKALQYLNQAENISLKNNQVFLGKIYSIKGSNHNILQNNEECFKYLNLAIPLLKKDNDTVMLIYAQATLAGNYMANHNYNFALDLYKQALQGYKRQKHWLNYYLTYINYAECLIQLDKTAEAIKNLKVVLPDIKEFGNDLILTYAYWKLAYSYNQQKNSLLAKHFYQLAQPLAIQTQNDRATAITSEAIEVLLKFQDYATIKSYIQNLEYSQLISLAPAKDQFNYQKQLGFFYEAIGQTKEALQAFKEVVKNNDSTSISNDKEELLKAQAQYQNELQRAKNLSLQEQNRNYEEKLRSERTIFWLGILVSVIAIAMLFVIIKLLQYRNKLNTEKLQRIEVDHQLIVKENDYQKQQKIWLEKDLKLKDLELENAQWQINNFVKDIANKEQHIREMSQEFNQVKRNITDHEIIQNYKIQLDDMASKAIVTDQKWDTFIRLFNAVHPEYLPKINQKFPNLTPAEIRYITLRKLNLSPRETATALGVQIDSLRLYKHRLRKKYHLENDELLAQLLE